MRWRLSGSLIAVGLLFSLRVIIFQASTCPVTYPVAVRQRISYNFVETDLYHYRVVDQSGHVVAGPVSSPYTVFDTEPGLTYYAQLAYPETSIFVGLYDDMKFKHPDYWTEWTEDQHGDCIDAARRVNMALARQGLRTDHTYRYHGEKSQGYQMVQQHIWSPYNLVDMYPPHLGQFLKPGTVLPYYEDPEDLLFWGWDLDRGGLAEGLGAFELQTYISSLGPVVYGDQTGLHPPEEWLVPEFPKPAIPVLEPPNPIFQPPTPTPELPSPTPTTPRPAPPTPTPPLKPPILIPQPPSEPFPPT